MPHSTTQGIKTAVLTQASSDSRGLFGRAFVTRGAFGRSRGTGARTAASSRARLAVAVTATLAALLLAFSAQALATTGHSFAGSFEAKAPVGVAVMASTGDVFTLESDGAPPSVQRFDALGGIQDSFPILAGFRPASAVAVDPAGAGAVYAEAYGGDAGFAGEVLKFSVSGTFAYLLDVASSGTSINVFGGVGLAVDPADGTVYVDATNNETGAQVIDSFSQATGAFIASFNGENGSPDGGFTCPSGLAVDPTHHVYVFDPCKGRVDRYSAAGAFEATVDDGSRGAPQDVASDPNTGEVYVAEASSSGLQITNFTAGGTAAVNSFDASSVAGISALAVGADGTVYAADTAHSLVDRFTAFVGPTVATEPATEVTATAATLNGTIDPGGIASEYHYEYGTTTAYGSSTAPIDAGSGSGAIAAPVPVTGLAPNTTYHYRIVGSNASGSIAGVDGSFVTAAAPATLDGSASPGSSPPFASAITPSSATIHATINPNNNFFVTYHLEYGTTTAYGSSAGSGLFFGGGGSDRAVIAPLSGLEPDTTYHFRVVADNDGLGGTEQGIDQTFITAPAAAASGSKVTTRQATLTGTIDPHGAASTYYFNYGPSTSYGASTPESNGGSGNGEAAVSEHIAGLLPGTTYHVQVVTTSNGITRSGADGTFTTAPAPTANVSDPIAVTINSATLQGAADTHGLAGSYHFEVTATEGSFSTSTPEQPLSAVAGAQPVSAPVGGLPSGQSLRVRLVVSSDEATEISEPVSFATAPPPPEGFPAPPSPGSLYGCTAPRLNPVNGTVKPGSTIAISGSGLGLEGSVLLGEDSLIATNWSASAFTIEVPAEVTGTLGLTVNCGVASNTVAVVVGHAAVRASTQPKARPTRAQLLAKALKSCAKKKGKKQRAACKRQAEKKYGAKKTPAKKAER